MASDPKRRRLASHRKPAHERAPRAPAATRTAPRQLLGYEGVDPSKWEFPSVSYNGSYTYSGRAQLVMTKVREPIEEGLRKLRERPAVWEGILYQSNMTEWPREQQQYAVVRRTGSGFNVTPEDSGPFSWAWAKYKVLAPEVSIRADRYTDSVLCGRFRGEVLGPPVSPGRGLGVADVPNLKIIDDADPSDVSQGGVGDCWLLSAISALAEFDGAIRRLFRNSPGLMDMPRDGANEYAVTLHDLPTWSEVDVVVDERLCTKPGGRDLLGCTPSATGELWPCYLEKAIAAHCGGWDKISGGMPTHAWRLLTGCKEVYTFRGDGRGFGCQGALNANSGEWEKLANSPHDGCQGLWSMAWPVVGGGGDRDMRLGADELFERMCAWEDQNYIMAAATRHGSDTETTDGIVDGHAYTVLTCMNDAGGTHFDLIKLRNPWGRGEYDSGMWVDDGRGWDDYPAVRAACNPVKADDGVFWMSKEEYFSHFPTTYLCAKDMTEFLPEEDDKDAVPETACGPAAESVDQHPSPQLEEAGRPSRAVDEDLELKLEVRGVSELGEPEYRVGDLTRGFIGRATGSASVQRVYAELELGGRLVHTFPAPAKDREASWAAERMLFAYGGEAVLAVRVRDSRGVQALLRGDPLIGEGSLRLEREVIADGKTRVADVPLLRGGEAAGKVSLKYRILRPAAGYADRWGA